MISGKPTARERERWTGLPGSVPPPPPRHYTEPPLYNPRAEATPYFSMTVAILGLVGMVFGWSMSFQWKVKAENLQRQIEAIYAESFQHDLDAAAQQEIEAELHLFEIPAEKCPPPSWRPKAKESKTTPIPFRPDRYIPWPKEWEEEGAIPVGRIPT